MTPRHRSLSALLQRRLIAATWLAASITVHSFAPAKPTQSENDISTRQFIDEAEQLFIDEAERLNKVRDECKNKPVKKMPNDRLKLQYNVKQMHFYQFRALAHCYENHKNPIAAWFAAYLSSLLFTATTWGNGQAEPITPEQLIEFKNKALAADPSVLNIDEKNQSISINGEAIHSDLITFLGFDTAVYALNHLMENSAKAQLKALKEQSQRHPGDYFGVGVSAQYLWNLDDLATQTWIVTPEQSDQIRDKCRAGINLCVYVGNQKPPDSLLFGTVDLRARLPIHSWTTRNLTIGATSKLSFAFPISSNGLKPFGFLSHFGPFLDMPLGERFRLGVAAQFALQAITWTWSSAPEEDDFFSITPGSNPISELASSLTSRGDLTSLQRQHDGIELGGSLEVNLTWNLSKPLALGLSGHASFFGNGSFGAGGGLTLGFIVPNNY